MLQMGAPQQAVGPIIADFLVYVVNQAGPQAASALQQILSMPPPELAQLLVEFAQSPAGGGSAPPPPEMMQGVPSGPPNNPTAMPTVSGPTPGSAPVGTVVGPGASGSVSAAPPQQPPLKKKDKKPRKVKAPSWEPPDAPKSGYGKSGPTYAQVIAEAQEGRDYYRDSIDAMQVWRNIYHQVPYRVKLDGNEVDELQGDAIVTRAQPTTMADRYIGMTSPDLGRLGLQADPWDDSDEGREAAQIKENFDRYALEEIYRAWNRRATWGDIQPPLDRKCGGLTTIEGGYAWRVMPNMDLDPERSFPWSVEPVSMMEVYPRPRATTRQVECTLAEAYTYDEIRDLLPDLGADDKDPLYTAQSKVRLITHTDETWYSLALEFGDIGLTKKVREKKNDADLWVYPPVKHGLGRRVFVLENPWNSTALGPGVNDGVPRAKFLYRGIYAAIAGQLKFIDQLVTAVRSGVFKDLNPPLQITVDPMMRAASGGVLPQVTQDLYDQASMAGGKVVLGPNEKIQRIVDAIAASPNATFLLQSAMGDLGDAAPPVLAGGGAAQSGFDRFQQSDAAGALHVDPMIAYHQRQLQLLLETIHADLVRLSEGDKPKWQKLPYKVSRSQSKGGAYRTMISAKDIKRAGPFIDVTYKRLGMTERMQMAQLNMMLVKEHMKSRLSAMDELGIDDTERETARMFAEAALEDPSVVKAAIKVALLKQAYGETDGEDGELDVERAMLDAYLEAREKEAQAEAQKGMPGMPSPTGAPGGGPPPPMPGGPAPGLPPVMTGG